MANEEDPLIQALPPATDYLTYLTLLEYQLTPARLPTLHNLLQDEVLTTNIGWDLVQLLLPMLPQSQECLQDIARLGNPREVILRVSEALMQLHPVGEDEEDSEEPNSQGDTDKFEINPKHVGVGSKEKPHLETTTLPLHVIQFNNLLAMLSVLHSRIQTKSPSRFLATSLQAVLEAYTSMPTSETTIALLEFLRDVSPSKRPAPPPRVPSESTVLRVSEASAPDPEAETIAPGLTSSDEPLIIKRFLQFSLIETLKSYMLSFTGPMDPGMSWAIRLQEKIKPEIRMPGTGSPTNVYLNNKHLKERDLIIAKITALSQDFGLNDNLLLDIVLQSPENQPPPLDFDEPPKRVEDIPLERHGVLLLLAARAAMAELFSSGKITPIPMFPVLAKIFSNFVGGHQSIEDVAFEQPHALLDSLLALTVFSMESFTGTTNETEFIDFILSLAACTVRQSYATVRNIPGAVVHSNPSPVARFKVIRKVLEQDHFQTIKDRAVGWLQNEILDATNPDSTVDSNLFLNPHYFSVLFPSLFDSSVLDLDVFSDISTSWVRFTQTLSPSIHAALNLYYVLISSGKLRTQLQLEKTYTNFRNRFLEPLKTLCHAFSSDLSRNGGDGIIEKAVGKDMTQVGMTRSVNLILHAIEQVEDAAGDAFVLADAELREPSTDDIAQIDAIRKETTC